MKRCHKIVRLLLGMTLWVYNARVSREVRALPSSAQKIGLKGKNSLPNRTPHLFTGLASIETLLRETHSASHRLAEKRRCTQRSSMSVVFWRKPLIICPIGVVRSATRTQQVVDGVGINPDTSAIARENMVSNSLCIVFWIQ